MAAGDKLRMMREIVSLPHVTVRMHGDACSEELYRHFVKPHPRYRVIQNKSWGASLLRVPDALQDYLRGVKRTAVRTNRNASLRAGNTVAVVDPFAHRQSIQEIHSSMSVREGQPMTAEYLSSEGFDSYFARHRQVYAVLDRTGVVRAYASCVAAGEVWVLDRVIGHGDWLRQGIMYYLITEVLGAAAKCRSVSGEPLWLMYDMTFGARPGMLYFKRLLDFRPYRVTWTWQNSH